ncbi:tetratricopeptide repeat protein [Paraflavitalea soli]|nr:tetratricopeptide repeat protein [Paraflavitalea soli]
MKRAFLLFCTLGVSYLLTAQTPLPDSLKTQLEKAVTDANRSQILGDLSLYYMGIDNSLADKYGNQMLEVGELSRNRELMIRAYLSNARRFYEFFGSQEALSKAVVFSNKALELARSSNLDDLTALAHTFVARGYRTSGETDKALSANNIAVSIASAGKNDSVKVIAYISLGNTYQARNEKLLAFRHYLTALDIAEVDKRYALLNNAYSSMSDFYTSLGNYEKAKDFAFKKERLERANNKLYDLLNTYNSIGQLYGLDKQLSLSESFFEKSIALADTVKFDVFKLNTYIYLVNLYLSNGQFEKALAFFKDHKEVGDFIMKAGMDFILYQGYGSMYTYVNKLDSAGYYFRLAEPGFETRASKVSRYLFYGAYAYYFRKKGEIDNAILYWQKAKQLGEDVGSLVYLEGATGNLDSLYQMKGDYKNAYLYSSLNYKFKDSLQKLSKEKDLLSLEIDNENRRKEREAKQQEVELERRHNIQYMGMVVAIAAIFILLVMAGIFRVSTNTIKVLGFFAFIFLFEFIILLADNQIHHWTHGEPWKVMLIKIILIALLLPLHHWLEEKVIHYLTSQKLLQGRGKNLVDRLRGRKKVDLPAENI